MTPEVDKEQYDTAERLEVEYDKGPLFTDEKRSLLVIAAISGLIACVIALGAAVYSVTTLKGQIAHSVNAQASRFAQADCANVAASRLSGDQFRFAVREELSFIPALVTASEKKGTPNRRKAKAFFEPQIAKLNNDLRVERATIPGLPKHIDSYGDLFGLLQDQPLIGCADR